MKNKFPYKGDTVTVTKDMCDMNGHMNVSFYSAYYMSCSTRTCTT